MIFSRKLICNNILFFGCFWFQVARWYIRMTWNDRLRTCPCGNKSRLGLLVAKKQGNSVSIYIFQLWYSALSCMWVLSRRSTQAACEVDLLKAATSKTKRTQGQQALHFLYAHSFNSLPTNGALNKYEKTTCTRWGAKGSEKRPTVTAEELQKHKSEEAVTKLWKSMDYMENRWSSVGFLGCDICEGRQFLISLPHIIYCHVRSLLAL